MIYLQINLKFDKQRYPVVYPVFLSGRIVHSSVFEEMSYGIYFSEPVLKSEGEKAGLEADGLSP